MDHLDRRELEQEFEDLNYEVVNILNAIDGIVSLIRNEKGGEGYLEVFQIPVHDFKAHLSLIKDYFNQCEMYLHADEVSEFEDIFTRVDKLVDDLERDIDVFASDLLYVIKDEFTKYVEDSIVKDGIDKINFISGSIDDIIDSVYDIKKKI